MEDYHLPICTHCHAVRVEPQRRYMPRPTCMRYVKLIVAALLTIAFATLMAVLVIEWMAGCGETYIDANGVRHQYECVFIPQPK